MSTKLIKIRQVTYIYKEKLCGQTEVYPQSFYLLEETHVSTKDYYIFLPTFVFFAPLAAEAFAAVALGAACLATFFSAPSSEVFLRERRVLGLTSSATGEAASRPNV